MLESYCPISPSDGMPRTPNDTWSVRPVRSSRTGVYCDWSAGRYAGTVWTPGSSGVEPVFLNSSGFSSGIEKLYFWPRSCSAWVTASAAELRNAWTAGRLCCRRWIPTAP